MTRTPPRLAASACLLVLSALLATSASATPAPPGAAGVADSHARVALTPAQEAAWLESLVAHSPHRRALAMAKATVGDLPEPFAPPSAGGWLFNAKPAALPAKKGRRLYGYLPYWTMSGIKLHWGELTQLSYFSAELGSDGNFGPLHGWGGSSAKTLIAQAHKNGVQVPLTVTLFSKSGIHNVIATAAKRTALVKKITNLVISGGGDGVNIDFEGMAKADKANMSAFINELNVTMKKQLPGADVTLATPAVDWTGAWDYDYLAEHSDGLMVMAYGLHWSGGSPGPNLPMASGGPWNHKTLPWVVDDYVKYGKAKNIKKFIIGLPLYGHAWPSSSDKPGAKSLGKAKSVTYEKGLVEAPTKGGWKWEPVSQSSYYVYKSGGTWTQVWSDTAKAFKIRVKYLDKRGTQMGLWALGYADKSKDVWGDIGWFMDQGKPTGGGSDAGSTDAGTPDAGAPDAGAPDAGAPDVGTPDTGTPDTGTPDTGTPDTGAPDTGTPDAGTPDTGTPDTGSPDAGSPDAGPPDNGAGRSADDATASSDAGPGADGSASGGDGLSTSRPDGGAPVGSGLAASSSGCTASPVDQPSGGLAWALLGAAAALLWRRRRSPRPRSTD